MIAHFYLPLSASSNSHKERIAQEREVATRILCQWIIHTDNNFSDLSHSVTFIVLNYLLKATIWGKMSLV
jgi:hypothetical protein